MQKGREYEAKNVLVKKLERKKEVKNSPLLAPFNISRERSYAYVYLFVG